MTEDEIRMIAEMMVGRHGTGASLLAYQHETRCMQSGDRAAAWEWCRVLVEVEALV